MLLSSFPAQQTQEDPDLSLSQTCTSLAPRPLSGVATLGHAGARWGTPMLCPSNDDVLATPWLRDQIWEWPGDETRPLLHPLRAGSCAAFKGNSSMKWELVTNGSWTIFACLWKTLVSFPSWYTLFQLFTVTFGSKENLGTRLTDAQS